MPPATDPASPTPAVVAGSADPVAPAGQPGRVRTRPRQPAQHGWHWSEWLAEAAGTALLLVGGLSAVCLNFGPHHLPWSHSWRLLFTGLLFAGSGSLVAITPLGRRSGAHLNPAVTLGFSLQRHLSPGDVAGYVSGQCAGALAGAGLVQLMWRHTAVDVQDGLTQPETGLHVAAAVGIEALMTGILVLTIFAMVSSKKTMRFTPLVLWPLIAVLVWQGARFTGTSLNPARSLGPAVVTADFRDYGVYVAGPLLGTVGAWLAWLLVPRSTLTAKLFHDPHYLSVLRAEVPVAVRRHRRDRV